MLGARITVDGLWRCLCPSIDAAALSRALSAPHRPRQATRRAAPKLCAAAAQRRHHLHTTSRRPQEADGKKQDDGHPSVTPDTEAKAGTAQSAAAPRATDSRETKALVSVSPGATQAWRGIFDVVLHVDFGGLQRPRRAGEEATDEVHEPEEAAQKHPAPTVGRDGRGSSSAGGDPATMTDPVDAILGSEKTRENNTVPVDDLRGPSAPIVEKADTGKDLSGVMVDRDAEKEVVAASPEVQRSQQDTVHTNDLREGASSAADASGSSASPPTRAEGDAKVQQTGNHEGPISPPLFKPPRRPISPASEEIIQQLLTMKPPFKDFPTEATKDELFSAILRTRMLGPKKYRKMTAAFLKHLLSMPGIRPNPFIYDTLFRAHSLPEGSCDVVNGLLKEMRNKKISCSTATYHSVLRLLAVHPDYLLRLDMIREMKERWIEILPKGHRYIAIGLLRDQQYELALDKLEDMIRQGIAVEPWVFDIFTYVFGKVEFLDDALRITRHRVDCGYAIPTNIWYYLLDAFSKGQHHEATTYVWNRTVDPGIVVPSDGVALNILNMAAVYGDADLATQVIQYLAGRGTRLSRPHYEALADAYSMQGQVGRAIEVYCIMFDAGAEVNQSSTGTLCQVMKRDPSLIDKAIEAMSSLKKKYKLPVAVYNAVLSQLAKSSMSSADEVLAKSLDLYRRIRDFVPTGPNLETFRCLLERCTRPDVAQFLAGEMVAFNIRQNLTIIELMLKVHVDHDGPLHRAKNYLFKVVPHLPSAYAPGSRRWQNIMDLSLKLVRRLIPTGDEEAWRILKICERNGLETAKYRALQTEVEAGRLAVVDPSPDADAAARKRDLLDAWPPTRKGSGAWVDPTLGWL